MADIVDYNYVGVEKKQQTNVVDYNIREEQSIDTYTQINANNNTSTGEANIIPGINEPKIIADTSIVGGGGGWAEIVDISNYTSIDEWQPVVERVLGGEFVCVRCAYESYSSTQKMYFIPVTNTSALIRFCCVYPGTHRFRINCFVTGTTITSITTSDGT